MVGADKRFLGQFAWVSGGRLLAAGLQAVSLVLIARFLPPSEFGLLSSVIGLATVLQTALDFGVGTFITRERAANRESGAIATALRFNSLSSALIALLVALGLTLMGLFVSPMYLLMLPLALWASGERNADARLTVVFADGDAWINVSNLLSRRVVGIVLFLLLHVVGVEPLLAYCTGIAAAAVGSSIFANRYVRRRIRTQPSISFRALINESRHYWANSVATQARNLDVVVVASFAGAAASGFYASASRLTTPLRILPTSLASTLIPSATRAVAAGRSLWPLLKPAGVMLAGVSAIYFALAAIAPWFVPLALGQAYVPAIAVIQVVLIGLPFAAGSSLGNALLQALGAKRYVASVSTITTIVCLVAASLASASSGAYGAGWALTTTFVLQSALVVLKLIPAIRGHHEKGEVP